MWIPDSYKKVNLYLAFVRESESFNAMQIEIGIVEEIDEAGSEGKN